jgi:ATP-dependent DNA helicase RecG
MRKQSEKSVQPVQAIEEQRLLDFGRNPRQLMSADELFDQADEDLLRELKEDNRIERKPAGFGGERLGEYFSMWANTAPDGGLIVCGQHDRGDFEGCGKLSQDSINQRFKTGYVFCPDAKYEVKKVAVTNAQGAPDFVILFRVKYHPDTAVRTSAGKAFSRKGDSKIVLGPDEIRELQADKGEISFELKSSGMVWPDDFDVSSASRFVEAVRVARNLSDLHSNEEVLEIRRLGEIRNGLFDPNYACALLFAKDALKIIPGCKVRFQRFEGEEERTGDRYNAVKDLILEGTVPELIQQVEVILESQLRTFSPLNRDVKFFPVAEYPKFAWYEAVVNACVHRSYGNGLKNMPIFVKMFDDRLVIESPGLFPPFVSPTNIYETHHPRNPRLMDAMFYLEYVKCAHEGTRRIRDTMAKMNLPAPEFMQSESGPPVVRVTLRNNVRQRRAWIDADASQLVSEAIAADLSENERRALNFAAENGSITISDANKLLNISWKKAKRLLFGLAQRRIFQYVRFREYKKNNRDPRAFFRLRSANPLPEGAFEQADLTPEISGESPLDD